MFNSRASILSSLNATKTKDPSPEPIPISAPVDTPAPSLLTQVIDAKRFRDEIYLKMVQEFIDTRCEFKQSHLMIYTEVRDEWNKFMRANADKVSKLNVSWRFNPHDIAKLDNRFIYKRTYVCKTCKRRHYSHCCEDYQVGHRLSQYSMVNLYIPPQLSNERQLDSVSGSD